jgi:uncharacterized protein YgbK (DUF1537 family)
MSVIQSALSLRRPIAVAIDAETAGDIEAIAAGVEQAMFETGDFIVRCGPALAGALAGATATQRVRLPDASSVLVVCGSYVPQSVRQLAALSDRFPTAVVTVAPSTLAEAESGAISNIAVRLIKSLDDGGLAVLAVDGPPPAGLTDLAQGMQIARGLSALLRAADRVDALVVLKGGVTSAVALRSGLHAKEADIVGPVVPGVALWRIREPHERSCLIVPGNVGSDELLVDLVDQALSGSR